MTQPTRVVIVEPREDDAGRAGSIARTMRDAGMEVVYLGALHEPGQIANVLVQEDAHAACVPAELAAAVRDALASADVADVHLFEISDRPADDRDLAALVNQARSGAHEA